MQDILSDLTQARLDQDLAEYHNQLANSLVWQANWSRDADSGVFFIDAVGPEERSLAKRIAIAVTPARADVDLVLVPYREREAAIADGAPVVALHGSEVTITTTTAHGRPLPELPVWPELFAANRHGARLRR